MFPGILPSFTITSGTETANGAAGGEGLSALLNSFENEIVALATKFGTGASTPASNKILVGTGAGTSAWQGLTSAQLAAIVSDETGTGVLVFGTSPTLTTPNISAPVITSPPTNVLRMTGEIIMWAGRRLPTDYLWCDGSAVSRSTYANLFNELCYSVGTCTITNATPAVVTLNGHGFQTGDQLYLTSTGTLPTGLSPNTLYYAVRVDANSFNLSTTRANAYAGTKIATSGAGSGVHTAFDCMWGLGDGSTTFNVPDFRGRTPAGNDSMGGTVAGRLSLAQSQGVYGNKGAVGGEQGHQITTAELASHGHSIYIDSINVAGAAILANGTFRYYNPGTTSTNNTGSDTPHNNVQPTGLTNFIVKT